MKRIATVIVVFGKSPHLAECLRSLQESEFPGIQHKVFVIDNTKENLGFTGGNNQGIQQALRWKADAVMLLNDDTKIEKNAVSILAKTLFSDEQIGVVSPKIYFYPGFEFHKDRYRKKDVGRVIWFAGGEIDWDNAIGKHVGVDEVDRGQYDLAGETEFATGCCALVKREVFEQVGLFDERYFLYLEDLDFSQRISRGGFQIVFQPKAIVWHKNAQSSGVGSGLHEYFFTRNRLLFGLSHAPVRTKLALVKESMRFLVNGSSWKRRGVIDFYLRKLGKGSWN